MKRIFCSIFLTMILFVISIVNVNAECSYQERKQLLNEAKSVDISVEPIYENNVYSFKFIISGMSTNLFIKYVNLNSGEEKYIFDFDVDENGIYTFIDTNYLTVYNYDFIIYTNNENCTGSEMYSKKVVKPMYNIYSDNINCTFENNKNFKYCQKFLEKNYNLNLEKFNTELIKYNMKNNISNETQNETDKSFWEQYWIYIVIGGAIIIVISATIFIVIKKKNEL